MSPIRTLASLSMVSLVLAACGPVGFEVNLAHHDGIQACADRLARDNRQLGALEKAILESFIYVRPRTLAHPKGSVELYHLLGPDGTPKLAVYSSKENLVKALGDGRYAKYPGEFLRKFNADGPITLNSGLDTTYRVEWQKGTFGKAADTTFPALPDDCITR